LITAFDASWIVLVLLPKEALYDRWDRLDMQQITLRRDIAGCRGAAIANKNKGRPIFNREHQIVCEGSNSPYHQLAALRELLETTNTTGKLFRCRAKDRPAAVNHHRPIHSAAASWHYHRANLTRPSRICQSSYPWQQSSNTAPIVGSIGGNFAGCRFTALSQVPLSGKPLLLHRSRFGRPDSRRCHEC